MLHHSKRRTLFSFALFIALLSVAPSTAQSSIADASAVAVTLGPPVAAPPRFDAALSDWNSAARFDRFFRVGGEGTQLSGLPIPSTQARLAWDEQNLYVAFKCAEPSRYAWAASHDESDKGLNFPDRVEVFVRPDFGSDKFWRFAIGSDGSSASRVSNGTGPLRSQDDAGLPLETAKAVIPSESPVFAARVVRFDGGWTAGFTIPWKLIGARPLNVFGLNVTRLRQQSGEYLSPLALDQTFYPPAPNPVPNEFMEARLGGAVGVFPAGAGLAALPSGIKFWNRPAILAWPTRAQRRELWQLQQDLPHAPTTPQNFAARVELANRFINALLMEGFSFDRNTLTWNPEGSVVDPSRARAKVNRALRDNDLNAACLALDETLRGLDDVARHWWADGSPGDVSDAWIPLSSPLRISVQTHALRLEGRAGTRPVALLLTLPSTGGARLRMEGQTPKVGSFEPPFHRPMIVKREASGIVRARFQGGSVAVEPSAGSIVVFDGANHEKYRLRARDVRLRFENGKIAGVDWSHSLRAGENVWGFGEWPNHFGLRHNVLTLWQQDGWAALNGGLLNQSYKTIPLYHLGRGASVFSNSRYKLRADLGVEDFNRLRLTSSGEVFDLTVWPGAPLDNLKHYALLTGTPLLPPQWAFQLWAGGGGRRWKIQTLGATPVDEQIAVMNRFRELDIPHSAIYSEGGTSSDPRLYAALAPLGIHILTWNRNQAGFPSNTPDAELPMLRREDGSVYRVKHRGLASQFPYLDWSHPGAMNLWRSAWQRRLDLGVAGSMIDFGDWTPEDAVASDGTRGDWLHNAYALQYHQAAHAVFYEKRGPDFILFARQAAPGSQKYVAAFAGDHLSNFKGLRAALRGALNFCSSGFSTWSVELPGYSGGWPDRETYIRGNEWGVFLPLMRYHGQLPREPWNYGPDAVPIYKHSAWTRENLLPAIYSYAIEANKTGVPMLRALPLIYPDAKLQTVDDEYLFGPDLLVAPMLQAGTSRRVVFPPGRWVHLWHGQAYGGNQARQIAAPLNEIPVFLRAGALLPVELAPSLKWGDSMTLGRVSALVVTPPLKAERRQWQSAGVTFAASSAPMKHGFAVNLPPNDSRALLIYGADVSQIVASYADGRALKVSFKREAGRVVVRLPRGVRRVEVTTK